MKAAVISVVLFRRAARRAARGKHGAGEEWRHGAPGRGKWKFSRVGAYFPELTGPAASSARRAAGASAGSPRRVWSATRGRQERRARRTRVSGESQGNLAAVSAGGVVAGAEGRSHCPQAGCRACRVVPEKARSGLLRWLCPETQGAECRGSRRKARCRIKKAPAGAGAFRNAGGRVLSRARRGTRYW